jgi:SAM-dependent methyltransferase
MKKLNFGCGSNVLDGWENYDNNLDIRYKLPFDDDSIDCIFAEHVIEHVTPHEAYNFIENCHTILKMGGILRVCVPSVNSIYANYTNRYGQFVSYFTKKEPTLGNAVKAIIFQHGHQSVWNEPLLDVMLKSVGFNTFIMKPEKYYFREFEGCDGHQKAISSEFNNIETISIDCIKINN